MKATQLRKRPIPGIAFASQSLHGMAAYQGVHDGDSFVLLASSPAALRRLIAASNWGHISDESMWRPAVLVSRVAYAELIKGRKP